MNDRNRFFAARVQSIPPSKPLAFDIYLEVGGNLVHFRQVGDSITDLRMQELQGRNLKEMFIPLEQREAYLKSIQDTVRDPALKSEVRGRFIKECAFNHISGEEKSRHGG